MLACTDHVCQPLPPCFCCGLALLHVCAPGVYGRVSELVKVTNRKYNLAMAVVMQRDLDSVVVDSKATGFACVDYLKASK